MAALLAGNIAVPAGVWFATITVLPLAFIGTSVLFLPLFVLSKVNRVETGEEPERFFDILPELIRSAMKADEDAVLDAFGKNAQTRKVFWPPLYRHRRPRAGAGAGPGSGAGDSRGDNRGLIISFFRSGNLFLPYFLSLSPC